MPNKHTYSSKKLFFFPQGLPTCKVYLMTEDFLSELLFEWKLIAMYTGVFLCYSVSNLQFSEEQH